MARKKTQKFDVYQDITDRIVEALENGVVPWHRPWVKTSDSSQGVPAGWPQNATTDRPYSGINVLLLWLHSAMAGYPDPRWLTFKQAQAAGGNVRKGEHGTKITFFKTYKKEVDGEEKETFVLRYYTVFNIEQCEGLEELGSYQPPPEPVEGEPCPKPSYSYERANAVVDASGAVIHHKGNRAAFSPVLDYIVMPEFQQFEGEEAYWATLLHELVHWTGHKSRLEREFGLFGSEKYAKEELVAEIGSAFLCAQVGIPLEKLQHPSYVKSWLEVLKGDKRAIVSAAAKARKGAEYLLALPSVSR